MSAEQTRSNERRKEVKRRSVWKCNAEIGGNLKWKIRVALSGVAVLNLENRICL